ncbi:glycosyltransferase family 2 protein [Cupriavidus consociatus]|uniref:glycosyltransferase family 2 protein n=1 Tax=Cupriavidus consociatus TaxID=2821357 RepID=UPI001AE4E9AD|nr:MULTISPECIES: glycosyltransferase [unclassified Cupriavidus]MBP0621455.1 glycosyltransferase family 2 protein [Cupriavidus sp. LEh25]MDK2658128.1 glycosyltransferase [Cupriavidus sp. LEh21]
MSDSLPKVTVVVPTYKRAHLLERTIPSYLQPEVAQLVLVDDCSPDDTSRVAKQLMERFPQVTYLRNDVNGKQTTSKNRGKALARTEFVYFGDDDSMLSPGALAILLQTARETSSDIVGASALYLCDDKDTEAAVIARRKTAFTVDQVVNLSRLEFDFAALAHGPLEVPVCHASFLIRTEAAKAIDFDTQYVGNCYREETDFLVRSRARGCRITYEPRALQINLPPSQATGGARGRGRLSYEAYALYNTARFLLKNRKALKQADARCNAALMLCWYVEGRVSAALSRASRVIARRVMGRA